MVASIENLLTQHVETASYFEENIQSSGAMGQPQIISNFEKTPDFILMIFGNVLWKVKRSDPIGENSGENNPKIS